MDIFYCAKDCGPFIRGSIYSWDKVPVTALAAVRSGHLTRQSVAAPPVPAKKRGRPKKVADAVPSGIEAGGGFEDVSVFRGVPGSQSVEGDSDAS